MKFLLNVIKSFVPKVVGRGRNKKATSRRSRGRSTPDLRRGELLREEGSRHIKICQVRILCCAVRQNHDGVFGASSNRYARSFHGWTKGIVVLE